MGSMASEQEMITLIEDQFGIVGQGNHLDMNDDPVHPKNVVEYVCNLKKYVGVTRLYLVIEHNRALTPVTADSTDSPTKPSEYLTQPSTSTDPLTKSAASAEYQAQPSISTDPLTKPAASAEYQAQVSEHTHVPDVCICCIKHEIRMLAKCHVCICTWWNKDVKKKSTIVSTYDPAALWAWRVVS